MTTKEKIENFLHAWNTLGNDVEIIFDDGVAHPHEEGFELVWDNGTESCSFNP